MSIYSSVKQIVTGTGIKPRQRLLLAIGSTAILWYYICIVAIALGIVESSTADAATVAASVKTASPDATIYQFMIFSVTTIAGTLATFVGMVLGYGQLNNEDPTDINPKPGGDPTPASKLTVAQRYAAWSYFLSLLLALAVWYVRSPAPVPQVIENLATSLLGLFGGALAVLLNTADAQ